MGLSRFFNRFLKPRISLDSLSSYPKHATSINSNKGFSLSKSHHTSSISRNPRMGSPDFHYNPSLLLKTPFKSSNRLIHGGSHNAQISLQDVDKLCKILSAHTGHISRIESSLNSSGVTTVSPELVEGVLKKLSNAGALALSFFRWAEKKEGFRPSTESYHALIDALGKIKQFKLVWNLVDEMKGKGLLTRETFGLIMRRYSRARKIKEALETFEKMEKFGMKAETADYNRLIDTLSKSKHVPKAQEVFDEMKKSKNCLPDLKTYTILMEGWGSACNMTMVREVLREMKDEGFEPDVVTYGIIINAYCKCRKYDEALEVVREMEGKKMKLSPHIYCTVINGLGAAKRLEEALEFFDESKKSGFTPELPTYNAVVGSYCYSNRFQDAFNVIEKMKNSGIAPNSRTYEIILHHLVKNRRTNEAYSVFRKMDSEHGCEPNVNAYTTVVRMFCEDERVDLAIKVWNEMKAKGILPLMHMFSSLINGLCQENRLDDACAYFQEMLDIGIRPPAQLYGNLKQALIDGGKNDVATSLGLKLDKIRKTDLVE